MTDSRPHGLRADHLRDALGVDATPRLSWKLPAGAGAQRAYRIVAGDWDSGRVESAESSFVPVDVEPASGLRVEWRVQVWADGGESEWSAPASWEYGLLDPSDWVARWVAPVEGDDLPPRQRPAYQLAGTAPIFDGEVARARLYATAHGVYEAFVNGLRVGDHRLSSEASGSAATVRRDAVPIGACRWPRQNTLRMNSTAPVAGGNEPLMPAEK